VELLVVLLACLLLAVVVLVVGAPLRAARDREIAGEHVPSDEDPERREAYERAQLEAAREAKYREIRDAELDLRTGKLSTEDFDAIDGTLRSEALAILDRLRELGEVEKTGEVEKASAAGDSSADLDQI
jgi:hypothetical protein